MSNQSKAVFKHALALIFLFTHSVSFAGAGVNTDATCSPKLSKSDEKVKACVEATKAASANGADAKSTGGTEKDAELFTGTALNGMVLNEDGKKKCSAAYEQCKAVCEGAPLMSKCEDFNKLASAHDAGIVDNGQNAGAGLDTQSATQAGGGGGDMMGMIMGAGIGGLMGYMMAKKMNEDKEKAEEANKPPPDGALLPNGQIDCSKSDAYMYGECNAWLEANCSGSTTPQCKAFENRYCSTDGKLGKASDGFVGEGIGTPFCKNSVAVQFCKGQNRTMCPSCLGLARNNSAACQQDPSLCLAQNSPEQINEAKKSCPTDPAFADPNYTAGGGSQVPDQVNNGSLPAVVLPQSVAAKAANGMAPASVGGGSSGSSLGSAGSQTAKGASEGAIREGAPSGVVEGSSGSAYVAGAAASGVARDVASTKGVNYRTASAEGRPSDVEGPFGPSLFKTSSDVIKSRCDAGKFNNCPGN